MAAVPLLGSLLGSLRGVLLGNLLASSPRAPGAAFVANLTSIDAGDAVHFSDRSSWAPTSWHWEKNSGSGWVDFAGTPTAQNPTETLAAGTWSVRLTATNATGSSVQTKTDYVVAAAGTFNPALVAGLKLGSYSEDGTYGDAGITPATTDTAPVGRWADTLSGLNHHLDVLGGAGTRPILKLNQINGYPSIRFDGVDDILQALYTLAQPQTVLLVAKQLVIGGANTHDFICSGGDDYAGLAQDDAPRHYLYKGLNATLGTGVVIDSQWGLLTLVFNGTSNALRVNGVQESTYDAAAGDPGGLTLGGTHIATRWTNVEFAAAFQYSGAITGTDLDYLEAGLMNKYGL